MSIKLYDVVLASPEQMQIQRSQFTGRRRRNSG